ncbi:hypothetical protein L226DRAFT_276214 [Lentinus tigrinus ALCF2SS1-7]|uniref:Uncharacterized protein n=1 Tax=Lentinus tigrinus ALCF2SS1-6 TaxID=1328759 RepID=A0A5C2RUX3_9APHY|nr:hypothetical protein L227DRAFT_347305 [Lentinus tigrinus ALCF2SS1-6]RPD69343.1 hypothetical protein L226DRAFT_276214 [Lentinus tigrinus ALCF2SS1-7]
MGGAGERDEHWLQPGLLIALTRPLLLPPPPPLLVLDAFPPAGQLKTQLLGTQHGHWKMDLVRNKSSSRHPRPCRRTSGSHRLRCGCEAVWSREFWQYLVSVRSFTPRTWLAIPLKTDRSYEVVEGALPSFRQSVGRTFEIQSLHDASELSPMSLWNSLSAAQNGRPCHISQPPPRTGTSVLLPGSRIVKGHSPALVNITGPSPHAWISLQADPVFSQGRMSGSCPSFACSSRTSYSIMFSRMSDQSPAVCADAGTH